MHGCGTSHQFGTARRNTPTATDARSPSARPRTMGVTMESLLIENTGQGLQPVATANAEQISRIRSSSNLSIR